MTPETPAPAGPLLHATLIVGELRPLVQAYAELGLVASAVTTVDAVQASAWGQPQLAGCRQQWLGPVGAAGLLRLIERPGTPPRQTRLSQGWLALEILVRDVDALAAALPPQAFEVVGPPADLDVSPNIRAMQVVGPAGEMLYLTQVKAPVPPFEVPLSSQLPVTQTIGPLFIAVMSTPSRGAALSACAALVPSTVLQFETKVTVLNRALGRSLDTRWPVATAQWAGACLFEIDEVQDPQVSPATAALPAGLAWIGIQLAQRDAPSALQQLAPGAWIETLPAPS